MCSRLFLTRSSLSHFIFHYAFCTFYFSFTSLLLTKLPASAFIPLPRIRSRVSHPLRFLPPCSKLPHLPFPYAPLASSITHRRPPFPKFSVFLFTHVRNLLPPRSNPLFFTVSSVSRRIPSFHRTTYPILLPPCPRLRSSPRDLQRHFPRVSLFRFLLISSQLTILLSFSIELFPSLCYQLSSFSLSLPPSRVRWSPLFLSDSPLPSLSPCSTLPGPLACSVVRVSLDSSRFHPLFSSLSRPDR